MRAQCRADGYGLRTHTHPNHPSPKAAKGKHNMDHQRVRHGVILSHGSHGCKNYNIQMSCNGQKHRYTRAKLRVYVRVRTGAGVARGTAPRSLSLALTRLQSENCMK